MHLFHGARFLRRSAGWASFGREPVARIRVAHTRDLLSKVCISMVIQLCHSCTVNILLHYSFGSKLR